MLPGDPIGACRRAALLVLLLALIAAAPVFASGPSFPRLSGRVVDDAHILSASTQSDLTAMLARHEQATGEQVVVVTLPSLQGYSIEDFGYQLGRYWGIGQKDKNTGALLIVAPKEHKVRIEVGYGLEGTLTDAMSRVIIERDILPEFKRGDFNAGVLAGTTTILKVLGGDATAAQAPAESSRTGSKLRGHVSDWPGILRLVHDRDHSVRYLAQPAERRLSSLPPRRPLRIRRLSWWRLLGASSGRWRLFGWRRLLWRGRRIGKLVTASSPLTPQEHERIHAAVTEAERNTAADLDIVVVRASDRYPLYPLIWAAFTALALTALAVALRPR